MSRHRSLGTYLGGRALAAIAVVLLSLSPTAARAAGCRGGDEGFGGTGHRDSDEGVGGTGVRAGDEDGVGGTGLRSGEDGVGGTGIIGTVTGFGSLCVNGLRVEYGVDTPIDVDGRAGAVSDLQLGQLVVMEAESTSGGLRARRIGVRHTVVGEITALDVHAGRVEVMGQSVHVAPGTPVSDVTADDRLTLDGLHLGETLAVSGLRRESGVIVASRLERDPTDAGARTMGLLVVDPSGDYRVRGSGVSVRSGLVDDDLADGGLVMIRGRWDRRAGRLIPESAEHAVRFDPSVKRLALEGFLPSEIDRAPVRVSGFEVEVEDLREGRGALRPGGRVWVRARIDRGGQARAERIERPPGRDDSAEAREERLRRQRGREAAAGSGARVVDDERHREVDRDLDDDRAAGAHPELDHRPDFDARPGPDDRPDHDNRPDPDDRPGPDGRPDPDDRPGPDDRPDHDNRPDPDDRPGPDDRPDPDNRPDLDDRPGGGGKPDRAD